jgi:hypothetical protein
MLAEGRREIRGREIRRREIGGREIRGREAMETTDLGGSNGANGVNGSLPTTR